MCQGDQDGARQKREKVERDISTQGKWVMDQQDLVFPELDDGFSLSSRPSCSVAGVGSSSSR